MKKLLLVLTITINTTFYGQEKIDIYDASGKFITSTEYINKVAPEYFGNEDVYQHSVFKDGIFTIAFIKYTDKVLFISLDGEASEKTIKKAIKSFSLEEYFKSLSFISDIKKEIKDKSFTDIKALRTFGKPEKSTESDHIKIFYYTFPNITLFFNNGILYDYVLTK